jgi:SAM-dependent methyltransferase
MSTATKIYNYMLNHPRTKRGYWGVWYFSKRYTETLNALLECASGFNSLLELGCGKGLYAYHLTKLRPNCEYVGCDLDRAALKQAFKHKNVSYILCDVRNLPICPYGMDIVLCSEVLEHLKSPYDILDSIIDLSRRIVLVTFPIEHLGNRIHTRHPEHVIDINPKKVVTQLNSKKLITLRASELSRFFIPCGVLEFLKFPKNRVTMLFVSLIDSLLRKLLPITFVPDQTILVVATRKD